MLDGGKGEDGGWDGGWVFARTALNVDAGVVNGNWAVSWRVRALGPDGMMAGEVAYPTENHVWVSGRNGQLLLEANDPAVLGGITGLGVGGRFCGFRYDQMFGGTAVEGSVDGGISDLAPGANSQAVAMSSASVLVQHGPNTSLYRADGGIRLITEFFYTDGGVNQTVGYDLNDADQVVGLVSDGTPFGAGNPTAFYWSTDGGLTLKNGGLPSAAYGINNVGTIVGSGQTAAATQVAIEWVDPSSAPTILPSPSDIVFSEARAISDRGLIVGSGQDATLEHHGLLWWRGRVYRADDVLDIAPFHVFTVDWVNGDRLAAWVVEDIATDAGNLRLTRTFAFDVIRYPN